MTFTVYSKQGCPYCDKIKIVLNDLGRRKGYSLVCYELGSQFTKEEFYSEFGEGSTFPQVILGEKHIGGCSDTIKYLQENNLL
jgi:glutaredoxin